MERYRRKPRRDTVHRKVCWVQDRSRRKDRNKGKASAKKQGESAGTVKRRNRNENVFAQPNGLRENAETRFRVGDLDLPERRNRYASSREEKEEDAQLCHCGKAVE